MRSFSRLINSEFGTVIHTLLAIAEEFDASPWACPKSICGRHTQRLTIVLHPALLVKGNVWGEPREGGRQRARPGLEISLRST